MTDLSLIVTYLISDQNLNAILFRGRAIYNFSGPLKGVTVVNPEVTGDELRRKCNGRICPKERPEWRGSGVGIGFPALIYRYESIKTGGLSTEFACLRRLTS